MTSLRKSPWVIHYDGSSCNGCDIEVVACLTPLYDVERLGVLNMGNPKHADVLLITGGINEQNKEAVRTIYEQMPDPKVVVAIGICATSGGIFADCYNILGGVDKVIPVDIYVPGCAARPELIIDGITKSLDMLTEKRKKLKGMDSGVETITIEPALPEDAPGILALQKLAYQSEAETFSDFTIKPLTQNPEELKKDFEAITIFKAVMGGKTIGSVRALVDKDTCHIKKLMVNPAYQHHGIGRKLVEHIEKHFSDVKRFEVITFHESKRNVVFYEGLRFTIFKKEKTQRGYIKIFMEKHI